MSSERARARLEDVVVNGDWVAEYLDGITLSRFLTDQMRVDAVERCLQRITEAVIQLGEEQSVQVGLELPWHDLRTLGNRLRHEYRHIDRRIIYGIAINDVPDLRDAAARALEA